VSSLALSPDGSTVYLCGVFGSIDGTPRTGLAAVDPSSGAPLPWSATTTYPPSVLAVSGSDVYIAGGFTAVDGAQRNNLAALDVTTGALEPWNPAAIGSVYDVLPAGGTIYAAGAFTQIGGVKRSGVAAIEATTGKATSWNPKVVLTGAPQYDQSYVWSLAASGSAVALAGNFTEIDGVARNGLATVNAQTAKVTAFNPQPLGYFDPGNVRYVYFAGPTLYAGGDFFAVSGDSQDGFAAFALP
jgi:hypothetical protein